MNTPHEYNYKSLGMKKYVIDYTIDGYERTCKEFAFSERGAKAKVRKFNPDLNIKFISVYEC